MEREDGDRGIEGAGAESPGNPDGPTLNYEYLGYLSTILYKPDPQVRDRLEKIEFGPDDLLRWHTKDSPFATEWQQVPVTKKRTEEGVEIKADFRDVLSIDSLSPDDPRYWAPLSTMGLEDERFPVDACRYPIIEVTYRCTSERAHPIWMWTYDGGSHFGALPPSQEWHTVVRHVQHFDFPSQIDDVVIRLYSPTRTVESMEVASVCFRAMSETESEAWRKSRVQLEERHVPKRFPLLDEFMPLGVYMDADTAKRLADMLGISAQEYWELVMEDLVGHYHNAVALAHVDRLKPEEWRDLLALGESHGVKFIPRHEFPVGGSEEEQRRVIETHIKPYADSEAILARTFSGEPIESDFHDVLAAKNMMEEGDPNHPVAIVARYPNAYPLFAPFFSASGVGYFTSRRPWELGKVVRTHAALSDAQQFWVAAPAFMYPTQTPEWSTCPEMRLMVNLAMANGARGWFAYSYHNDPVWLRGRVQRTLTGPFLTFSDLWAELMQRMKRTSALAPLLLKARPEDEMDDWFVGAITSETDEEPVEGVPPISHFHLRGPDYSLYITVSNNIRDMAGVDIQIPRNALKNQEIYDLTTYVRARTWETVKPEGHLEMFPGQAQILLAASPERCAHWHEVIASRLIESDLRKLQSNLRLARQYTLDVADVERKLDRAENGSSLEDLETVHAAKDALLNLIYDAPAIREARSKIIEASAAVCACDGTLCRLMARGKKDRAEELGKEVVPLAREFTGLRLEIRRGNGLGVVKLCEDLCQRSLALLGRIRAEI